MTILISYDGSGGADYAIAEAARLLPSGTQAVVLTVWEPLVVQALRAERYGSPVLPVPLDVQVEDEHSEHAARLLAEHGARVAGEAGFDARPLWVADDRAIATTIIGGANELGVDLIVMGARGLAGVRAFVGSVSNQVLQHSSIPLLVVPAKARPEDAAVARDGSSRASEK